MRGRAFSLGPIPPAGWNPPYPSGPRGAAPFQPAWTISAADLRPSPERIPLKCWSGPPITPFKAAFPAS